MQESLVLSIRGRKSGLSSKQIHQRLLINIYQKRKKSIDIRVLFCNNDFNKITFKYSPVRLRRNQLIIWICLFKSLFSRGEKGFFNAVDDEGTQGTNRIHLIGERAFY